ncbi:hypothetical protein, partial [Salmonella enterica]
QLSPDGGFGQVEQTSQQRLGHTPAWNRSPQQTQASSERVRALLHDPAGGATRLASADDAVQIALLHNPDLQADFAGL